MHSFYGEHNPEIVSLYKSRHFGDENFKEILKKNYEYQKKISKDHKEFICLNFITRSCNYKNCRSFHIPSQYCWQFLSNDTWIQFSRDDNDKLEIEFCDPNVEFCILQNVKVYGKNAQVFKEINKSKIIKIKFEEMRLETDSQVYEIKRLSTLSDIHTLKRTATRWIWYWKDDDNSFKPYVYAIFEKFSQIAFSDYLEDQFHDKRNTIQLIQGFTIGNQRYKIDLANMVQHNLNTGKVRPLRRRPVCYVTVKEKIGVPKKESTFLSAWCSSGNKESVRSSVERNSNEFIHIQNMMMKTVPNCKITSMERVQNQYLWKAYQLKKEEMQELYNDDHDKINEQYMFHGTCQDAVDPICNANLDWRLYGTNVGNVYGKGTYFANTASLSDCYSKSDENGIKIMFVCFVLVGLAAVGNKEMELPPINKATGRCYDSTVNSSTDPNIFVKYNLDEYYPAYIVSYRS